ncbi:MAG: N-acetylglucosamine kinase [Opitutales bacterium]
MGAFLGIDGGGTRTRALLLSASGEKLHYAESGPSNLNAADITTVRNSLRAVIDSCLQHTDRPPKACLGLAGASAPEIHRKLVILLNEIGLTEYTLSSDAEISLEAAFEGYPGILLIAGTGSVCLCKGSDGQTLRTGGWGWLADDVGSAGWIGQMAIATALKELDKRLPPSGLKDVVFEQLQIEDPSEIIPKLYQPIPARSEMARLAPSVFRLAEAGNDAANAIMDAALAELEQLVRTARASASDEDPAVVFHGGLLENNLTFRKRLEARLSDFKIEQMAMLPVEAALARARRRA